MHQVNKRFQDEQGFGTNKNEQKLILSVSHPLDRSFFESVEAFPTTTLYGHNFEVHSHA